MCYRFNLFGVLALLFGVLLVNNTAYAQEHDEEVSIKNQLSTNLILPLLGSFDLSYEYTIANKWAVGVGGAIYGDSFSELSAFDYTHSVILDTKYEVTPFIRVYFQGAQNKSHFVELFGSMIRVEENGRFIRNTNDEGYGVYVRERRDLTFGGLGVGYGYRFLFLNKKLVLEGQVGFRTNFNSVLFVPLVVPVRGGIKVGYRF